MNIKLKDTTNCNGWVLVLPKRLTCPTAKNIHLVEVHINDKGEIDHWSKSTFCEEALRTEKNYIADCIFRDTAKGRADLRNKVAAFQNGASEICGTCAGHLYADCAP